MPSLSVTDRSSLAQLDARTTLPVGTRMAVRVAWLLALWSDRHRTRLHLGELSPHLLRDIGLTSEAAEIEAAKPFWRP